MSKADYIEGVGGLPVFKAPFGFEDVNISGFFLKADKSKLKAMCDKYLNSILSEYEYRPISSYVVLTYADMKGRSKAPSQADIGYVQESEVAFWVVVGKFKKGIVDIPVGIGVFLPHLFLDNSFAMLAGREVYGFNKVQAVFNSKPTAIYNPEFNMSTLGFKEFSRDSLAEIFPLISVKNLSKPSKSTWSDGEHKKSIFELIEKIVDREHFLLEKLESSFLDHLIKLFSPKVPMIFLKQFRDATDSSLACYQAIIEADAEPTHFNSGGFLDGEFEIKIEALANYPLIEEFGFDMPDGKCVTDFGFWLDFSFELDNGVEIS